MFTSYRTPVWFQSQTEKNWLLTEAIRLSQIEITRILSIFRSRRKLKLSNFYLKNRITFFSLISSLFWTNMEKFKVFTDFNQFYPPLLPSPRVAIWPFLKLFARNKMVWPFGHFLAVFESWQKEYILRPILDKSEQISNILWNSKF